MTTAPSFDDVFAAMAAASVGDLSIRVTVPEKPQLDDIATKFAIALNILLEDLMLHRSELHRLGDAMDRERADEKFRSLLEAASDAVVIVDRDGRIVLVNEQTERLFGYARRDLLEREVEILVPERLRSQHLSDRVDYLTNPRPRVMGSSVDLYGCRKDGSEFPIEISLSPLVAEGGLLVSSTIRDISERKKGEEQRFLLAAIVDSSNDAIIGKTLGGIATSWNEGAQRIFGYTSQEIVGKSLSILVPASREDEDPSILAKLGRGERVEHFDTVRRRKDGVEIHVSMTSSPVRDSRNKVIGASTIIRDTTERRHVEDALARAKDAADKANRELEAFSYSVAHDLRAPLRGMNGFAQLLLDSYKDKLDADGQDWLQEIVLNAKKMGELIDALLSLARVSRIELRRGPVDLSAIVQQYGSELAALEPHRVVELVLQANVGADADSRLALVLVQNLIGNAWKFTSRSSAARIEFGTVDELGPRVFFVRDNGAGFDMAFASKLFAPFQRLHTSDEFPGTGIGLATVQRIVQQHGGRVWAEGAVDGGATFYFTLPERGTGLAS